MCTEEGGGGGTGKQSENKSKTRADHPDFACWNMLETCIGFDLHESWLVARSQKCD